MDKKDNNAILDRDISYTKFHTMEFGTTGSKEILSSIGCLLCFTAKVSVNSGLAVQTQET